MKIIPLGAELVDSDGRTDMTKLTNYFRDLRESSYKGFFRSSLI